MQNGCCAPFPDDGRAEGFHDLHHCLRDLRPDAIARYERHRVGPAVAGQRHVGHETPRPRADQIPKLLGASSAGRLREMPKALPEVAGQRG